MNPTEPNIPNTTQPNPTPPPAQAPVAPPQQPVAPPPPSAAPAPQAPPPQPTPPPKGNNKKLIIILAIVGGIVILTVIIVALAFAFSAGQNNKKTTQSSETTSQNTTASNSEPTLPSSYVPINTTCYRVAAPTDNSLQDDSACYIHVDYGASKSSGYMIAELTGSDNATSVASWKKSNTYTIVSEENVKVDGFGGVKIVYSRPVGSKTVKGVIVFVATPTKKYMDGTFAIPGFEASSAYYENDTDKSKDVFDTLISTWHWK